MARHREGALTAGLIFMVIGVIFLLETWSQRFSAWHLIATYWPVIFIIIGIKKIYGYFAWQESPPVPDNQVQEQTRSN